MLFRIHFLVNYLHILFPLNGHGGHDGSILLPDDDRCLFVYIILCIILYRQWFSPSIFFKRTWGTYSGSDNYF